MALDYHFRFSAPASEDRSSLKAFFETVHQRARDLGFQPCICMAVPFEGVEQSEFVRRLTTGEVVQRDEFIGIPIKDAYSQDLERGEIRLLPKEGVFLVVTDNQAETVFALFRYPETVNGVKTGIDDWRFRDFVSSPDPRYRELVKMFADAGYLAEEIDEYGEGR